MVLSLFSSLSLSNRALVYFAPMDLVFRLLNDNSLVKVCA